MDYLRENVAWVGPIVSMLILGLQILQTSLTGNSPKAASNTVDKSEGN